MYNKDNRPFKPFVAGFSLLELSIVIIVVALVAGTGMVVGKATLESAQLASTNNKLNTIETTLLAFRRTYDRIPCPADLSLTGSSASFGVENPTPGNCYVGSPGNIFQGGTNLIEGGVPVRSLGLPDEFAYDGWGRKFVYSVFLGATANNGFKKYGLLANCGGPTVSGPSSSVRSLKAVYVLLSMGPNGRGAYNELGNRTNGYSVNNDETTNCHCTSSGNNTATPGSYVMRDPTVDPTDVNNGYDDIVRFKERWQLKSSYDDFNPGSTSICLDFSPGFKLSGFTANPNFVAGTRVGLTRPAVAIGDINGDGINDFVVSDAPESSGKIYVIYGIISYPTNPFDITAMAASGSDGFIIDMSSHAFGTDYDENGYSVAVADFNNDGFADVIIGMRGAVYIVYGAASRALGPTSTAGTINGFYGTPANDNFDRIRVATADVNNDGIADIIIGEPNNAATRTGSVYVLFGGSGYSSATTANISSVNGTTGFRINGTTASDRIGAEVAGADVNGDGYPDIIFTRGSAIGAIPAVDVIFGRATWPSAAMNTNVETLGFGSKITDPNVYQDCQVVLGGAYNCPALVGYMSLATGDINGDGIADIVIGTPYYPTYRGSAYVIFGHTSKWSAVSSFSQLNGTNGFSIIGQYPNWYFGRAVTTGDINGDGIADLLVSDGATLSHYVHYWLGKRTAWAASDTTGADGENVNANTFFNGSNGTYDIGKGIAVGDVNGDGVNDLITGNSSDTAAWASATGVPNAYIVYGQTNAGAWAGATDDSGF